MCLASAYSLHASQSTWADTTFPGHDASASWTFFGVSNTEPFAVAPNENRVLLVFVEREYRAGAADVRAVTYAGLPLTRLMQAGGPSTSEESLWYLAAPPAGTHPVTVAMAGGGPVNTRWAASSYFGVSQSRPTVMQNSGQQEDSLPQGTAGTLRGTAPGSLVVDFLGGSGRGLTRATSGPAQSQTFSATDRPDVARGYGNVTSSYTSGGGDVTTTEAIVSGMMRPWAYMQLELESARASAPPASTEAPALTGAANAGSAIQSSTGGWSNSPTSYDFRWQSCDASGAGCTDIPGAGGNAYTLSASDVGRTVRVVVTASNGDGSASATSLPLGPVAAPATTGGGAALPTFDYTSQPYTGDHGSASNCYQSVWVLGESPATPYISPDSWHSARRYLLVNPRATDSAGHRGRDDWWLVFEHYWDTSDPAVAQGQADAFLDLHNVAGDVGPPGSRGIGWGFGNRVSPLLEMFNGPGTEHYLLLSNERWDRRHYRLPTPSLGRWHQFVMHVTFGRTDGTTVHQGAVQLWMDGSRVLDLHHVDTLDRAVGPDGKTYVQNWVQVLQGTYIQGAPCWPKNTTPRSGKLVLARFGSTLQQALHDVPRLAGTTVTTHIPGQPDHGDSFAVPSASQRRASDFTLPVELAR